MKTALPDSINTIQEAKKFLLDLYNNDESYHPEDRAEDIFFIDEKGVIDKNSKRFFSDEEAEKLNELMSQIYEIDGNDGNHADPVFDPCAFLLRLQLDKTFLFKDKTGRGITNKMEIQDLLMLDEEDLEESDSSEKLGDWVEYAEEGDEWENRIMKIICTNTKSLKK